MLNFTVPCQPRPRNPPFLNGELLYQRVSSSILIATHLASGLGNRNTVFMDHCFGSGKTSLMFKFRDILRQRIPLGDASMDHLVKNATFDRLMSSIFLHIPFEEPARLALHDTTSSGLQSYCESFIVKQIQDVLEFSLQRPIHEGFRSQEDLRIFISSQQLPHFLFHFDDVGAFESISLPLGMAFLCCLWKIGELLSRTGMMVWLSCVFIRSLSK